MKAIRIGVYLSTCFMLLGVEVPGDAPLELVISYYLFVLGNLAIAVCLANKFIK